MFKSIRSYFTRVGNYYRTLFDIVDNSFSMMVLRGFFDSRSERGRYRNLEEAVRS